MSNELAKFQEITASAPMVLEQNKSRVVKATEAGQALILKMAEGMNDQKDDEANAYLVKARKTLELIMEQRKPITQLLDAFKKEFTTIEAALDPKRAESVVAQIQQARNNFATAKLAEQKKREAEAERLKAYETEKATVTAGIETQLGSYITNVISAAVQTLHDWFNATTLNTLDETAHRIATIPENLSQAVYDAFTANVQTQFVSKEEKAAIKAQIMQGKADEYKQLFKAKVAEAKADLSTKIPSRRTELEAIAEAEKTNQAEAARLKALQDQKAKDDADRLAKEKAEADAKIKAEADAKAKAAEMQAHFDATATSEPAKERTGYEIIVKHPAAYGLIFSFWFEKEGKDLPIDQLDKKTLGQMKAFCEKYAHKNSETIKTPYIEYKEQVKVQARK
ncbi:hypothetical protein LX69_01111 [Breznakibacter xylanolyticus]|uniref:Uncharacterized protein n=1 Tax=Breznakibacter xylanolyticus TaxID=990 RepID=A0A2W7NN42_9BACT|nr:hypothetical protein [Breznakibacter xylanolyticus]PZX18074.1 hypothetical protein LX69_01111 [Breznakibacter xylanolyticus]